MEDADSGVKVGKIIDEQKVNDAAMSLEGTILPSILIYIPRVGLPTEGNLLNSKLKEADAQLNKARTFADPNDIFHRQSMGEMQGRVSMLKEVIAILTQPPSQPK